MAAVPNLDQVRMMMMTVVFVKDAQNSTVASGPGLAAAAAETAPDQDQSM